MVDKLQRMCRDGGRCRAVSTPLVCAFLCLTLGSVQALAQPAPGPSGDPKDKAGDADATPAPGDTPAGETGGHSGGAAPAPAHTPPTGDDPAEQLSEKERKARAKSEFRKGQVAYRISDFPTALGHFQEAAKLFPRPSISFNLGQSHRQLKQYEKARFFYKLYLSQWQQANPGTSPPNQAEVNRRVAEMEVKIAEVEEERRKEAARKALEARKEAARKEAEREAARRQAQANAKYARQKANPGTLKLVGVGVDGARVLVDGVQRGKVPLPGPLTVPSGDCEVEIVAEGYKEWVRLVRIDPDDETTVMVALEPETSSSGTLLALSITSMVVVGAGEAVAWFFYTKAENEVRGSDNFEKDRNVVIAGHVVAGVMGAAAVGTFIGYLVLRKMEREQASAVEQAASLGFAPVPGGGGFAVGRFHF